MTSTHSSARRSMAARLWAASIALAAAVMPAVTPVAAFAQAPDQAPPVDAVAAQPAAITKDANDEIVYIDGQGFIRVLDPRFGDGPAVLWVSPEDDFDEIALGDFNNDSDMEIIGIKPNRVVIYDPVVASGTIIPGQEINGIPWIKLFDLPLTSRPILVAAGNFDVGVPGDEFIVVTEVPEGSRPEPDDLFRLDIYKQSSQTPDGRAWGIHIGPRYFEEGWERAAVGDVIAGATEEIALTDEDSGKFAVYRVDNGFNRIEQLGDSAKPFRDAAMGNWDGDISMEVAAVRDATQPLPSLFVLDWTGNDFEEDVTTAYDPAIRRLVFSDVNASGDDELYLLRNVPGGDPRPHLISRNNGSDGAHEWKVSFPDNEWRALTAGDIDGDFRGELILGRADRIRIYWQPERDSTTFQDYPVTTNRRSLITGNLDTIGFNKGPVFVLDKTLVEVSATAGSPATASLRLRNGSTAAPIVFGVTVEGSPAWLTVAPTSGRTPANNGESLITLTFNTSSLLPGTYRSRVVFTSPSDPKIAPISAAVTLMVLPAVLSSSPASINISGSICVGPGPVATTVQVAVIGSPGLAYSAAIIQQPTVAAATEALGGVVLGARVENGQLNIVSPDGRVQTLPGGVSIPDAGGVIPDPFTWLTASNVKGAVADVITLQIASPTPFLETVQANLLLIGGPGAGAPPQNLRVLPLNICPVAVISLPASFR